MTHESHSWKRVLPVLALMAGVFAVAPGDAQRATPSAPRYLAGDLLIKFRPEVTTARRNARVAALSGRVMRRLRRLDVEHLQLPAGTDIEAVAAALRADPEVVAAQPNYVRT